MHRSLLILAAVALTAGSSLAQEAKQQRSDASASDTGGVLKSDPSSAVVRTMASSTLEAGANSFTEEQARARLEGAGLAGVSGLHKDGAGIWRGHAVRNGLPVDVGFDFKGEILAQ